MSTDHERINKLERRVEMLADEISRAVTVVRQQASQLISAAQQLVANAETQVGISDAWQVSRNHNEMLTQELEHCKGERAKLELLVTKLRHAAAPDSSGEGGSE